MPSVTREGMGGQSSDHEVGLAVREGLPLHHNGGGNRSDAPVVEFIHGFHQGRVFRDEGEQFDGRIHRHQAKREVIRHRFPILAPVALPLQDDAQGFGTIGPGLHEFAKLVFPKLDENSPIFRTLKYNPM